MKPENILLDSNRNIKIADFGFSNYISDGNALMTSCGSPFYASPEILQNYPYDGCATDMWSCGIILYATLTG